MVIDSHFYMDLALAEAWKYQGLTYPNPAVGCCIVGSHGEILAINAHQRAGTPHAEVLALQNAYFQLTHDKTILNLTHSEDIHNYLLKNHNGIFYNVSLYSTLEPCSHIGKTPSCASLISQLKIKKTYIGIDDFNFEASNGSDILKKNNLEVFSNINLTDSQILLEPFKKFHQERFVFFKWAQRLNATVDGGIISSQSSRIHVHKLRDVCDLLVIGGNTVRIDRPTLDARLVNGKAPDILIVSNSQDFDRNIPLFKVKNRKVFIEKNFQKISQYKNIMIEGGAKMFSLSKDIVDWYLCYIAPQIGGKNGFNHIEENEQFEILYSTKNDEDIILWMKRKR